MYMKKIIEINKKNLSLIIGIVFAMLCSISISVVISMFFDILTGTRSGDLYLSLLVILGLTIVSGVASIFLGQYFPLKLQLKKSCEESISVISNVFKLTQKEFNKKDKGYYMNIATSSAFTFGDIYGHINVQLFGNILCIIILLIISSYINIYFGILFTLYIPLCWIVINRPSKKISNYQKEGLPTQDAFLTEIKKVVESKRPINIAGAEDYFLSRYKNKVDNYLDFIKKYRFYEIVAKNIPDILSATFQVVILWVSTHLYLKGHLTVGIILLMFQLSGLLKEPVNRCFEILIHKDINQVHIDRLVELENNSFKLSGFEKLYKEDFTDLVEIQGANFYTTSDKDKLLFEVKNLKIPKNKLIVIKGENGSGKSMFLNYITGYSDVDSVVGHIKLNKILSNSAYLTYPVLLVDGDLNENMFGQPIKKELLDILKISFDDKLISDKLVNLSFGEQQKLNLLRVLSQDKECIILDEPFTNLDKGTIERLTDYIGKLKKEKTIIAITHGSELDNLADYILYIKNHKLYSIKDDKLATLNG